MIVTYCYNQIVDPFVWNSLQSRFKNDAKLSDIFGGTEYRKLMEPEQFLSKPENITFCLNTDGVAVFKSSTTQIWPIWLQINELPPKMRYYYYDIVIFKSADY